MSLLRLYPFHIHIHTSIQSTKNVLCNNSSLKDFSCRFAVDCSRVSVGPRLTNLLTDISHEESLSLEDVHRFVPLQAHHTLQLCAYVFHDERSDVLSQLPCATLLAEYGFLHDYDFDARCRRYEELG